MTKTMVHRNPERIQWMSGYGIINREIAKICNSTDLNADIHFYASPPISFTNVDKTKFNVALTMCERDPKSYKNFDFVGMCNQMDLILTTGPWQKQMFQRAGIKPPVEMVMCGHDHDYWKHPVRTERNTSGLIMDRGRDNPGSLPQLQRHFDDILYIDCRTPKPTNEANKKIIKSGRYTQDEVRDFYHHADIFMKWGREGWCFPNLEAMSAGCLVITNCFHLPYIEHNKNCLVFRNIDELAAVIKRAAEEPCTELKIGGQLTAATLTWDSVLKTYRDFIDKHAG